MQKTKWNLDLIIVVRRQLGGEIKRCLLIIIFHIMKKTIRTDRVSEMSSMPSGNGRSTAERSRAGQITITWHFCPCDQSGSTMPFLSLLARFKPFWYWECANVYVQQMEVYRDSKQLMQVPWATWTEPFASEQMRLNVQRFLAVTAALRIT